MTEETIKPTPFQTGQIIVNGLLNFPFDSLISKQDEFYDKAKITINDYSNELFLISVIASIYAVRSASIVDETINEIIQGFLSSLRLSTTEIASFAIKNMEEVYPYYVEANQDDLDKSQDNDDLSDVDMAFGDRLFHLYGEDTEERGNACAFLSMAVPKALWEAHFNSTCETLQWSGLCSTSQ